MNSTKELAKRLCDILKEYGFVVQYQESVTTNSIYIKLDYGVANSIRVSDHKGKPKYSFRYNLYTQDRQQVNQDIYMGYPRRHYGANQFNNLVSDILRDKQEKIKRYGQKRYYEYMRRNLTEKQGTSGFWSKAITL